MHAPFLQIVVFEMKVKVPTDEWIAEPKASKYETALLQLFSKKKKENVLNTLNLCTVFCLSWFSALCIR